MSSRTPYRINAVSELTGVPEATLRAWERRYAIPKPARTSSGYRLYTQVEVEQVRRMRELCATGVSPREAAEVVTESAAEDARFTDEGQRPHGATTALEDKSVRFVELVNPEQTNQYGTVFSGFALAWMEKAAFVVATRHARRRVETVSSERVDFHSPVQQGQLVELCARVTAAEGSTMSVEVDLTAETLLTGKRDVAMRGRFSLMALDDEGKPTVVPQLGPFAAHAPSIPTASTAPKNERREHE